MSRLPLLSALCLAAGLFFGCTPEYPKCNNDENCKKGEFCVNGMCQQCRTDQDCGSGKLCQGGRCNPGCRTSDDCPDHQACKGNKCVACASDSDCAEGQHCKEGRCLRPGQCVTDKDCPPNNECQNGVCVAPPRATGAPAPCSPQTVYFDFNESILTVEATAKLQDNLKCIQSVPGRKLRLEGHCDPRGTEEYNVALGDRRAQSVVRYLERLGVDAGRLRAVSKGKLEATGTSESTWALDRKVKFIWE